MSRDQAARPLKAWIRDFYGRHKARMGGSDWPDTPSDVRVFLEGWIESFAEERITESEADNASMKLQTMPPAYRSQHLPMLVQQVQAARRCYGTSGLDRERAITASRGCERCYGSGLASVWAPLGLDYEARVPETRTAHCVCAMGRWMRSKTKPSDIEHWLDLEDVIAGKTNWRLDPPGMAKYAWLESRHFSVSALIKDLIRRGYESETPRASRLAPAPLAPVEPTAQQISDTTRRRDELNAQLAARAARP